MSGVPEGSFRVAQGEKSDEKFLPALEREPRSPVQSRLFRRWQNHAPPCTVHREGLLEGPIGESRGESTSNHCGRFPPLERMGQREGLNSKQKEVLFLAQMNVGTKIHTTKSHTE